MLAKEAYSYSIVFVVLDNPPLVNLCSILDLDASSLYTFKALSQYFACFDYLVSMNSPFNPKKKKKTLKQCHK